MALKVIRALVDPLAHVQSIAVPGFVRFLSVAAVQGGRLDSDGHRQAQPAIFALGDLEEPARVLSLRVFQTGHDIPAAMAPTLEFIGTVASREGQYACHIFHIRQPGP